MKDMLGAALPLAIRAAIDCAHAADGGLRLVVGFCGLMILVSLFKGLFQYWMRVILIGISRDVEYDLRNDLFARLVTLDAEFYGRMRTGDILARATNDMNAVRMMLGPGVMYWFETSLTLVLSVAVMLSVDWRLTLVALIPAPLVTIAVLGFGRRIHDRFEAHSGDVFRYQQPRAGESDGGPRGARVCAGTRRTGAFRAAQSGLYRTRTCGWRRFRRCSIALLTALVGISFLLVLWMGGMQLAKHKITLGSFVMFYTYMGMLVWPMIAMGWVANLMERGRASLGRVRELLDERPRIAAPATAARVAVAAAGRDRVARRDACGMATAAALDGVNLRMPAGATVAIVGHTGSGKSTLAHLIPRLIDPTAGVVTLDRHRPARIFSRGFAARDRLCSAGDVPVQRDARGKHRVRREGCDARTRFGARPRSRAWGRISTDFRTGLKRWWASAASRFRAGRSSGRRSRGRFCAIRAILILDDALASVDTATEERILTELSAVMRGRTTILISHRVSTIRNADRIFVLEHGQVVAEGSHAELLARGGYYADLYQKQLLEEELEAI